MDEKKTLLRLSRHLELIDILEKLPLTDDVKLSELTKNKVQQVAVYKDKSADKFTQEMGTPIDYLCWIASLHNRFSNKSSLGKQCRPDIADKDQFFSKKQYPNCEVRLYFRNPDLFMREDSDCADVYNRMVVMSLIFANQYISQKELSGENHRQAIFPG